jgi:hypothetical protein
MGSVSTIRKGQLEFSFSKDAVVWIKEVVAQKVENQQAMLLSMMEDDAVLCEKGVGSQQETGRLPQQDIAGGGRRGPRCGSLAARVGGGSFAHLFRNDQPLFCPKMLNFWVGRSTRPPTW